MTRCHGMVKIVKHEALFGEIYTTSQLYRFQVEIDGR